MRCIVPEQSTRVDVLKSLLMHAVAYHNHKELMAYLATTLYVSAAAVAAFSNDVWSGLKAPRSWVMVGMVIGAWAITHVFVSWQLRNRANAAHRIANSMNELIEAADLSKDRYKASTPRLGLPE